MQAIVSDVPRGGAETGVDAPGTVYARFVKEIVDRVGAALLLFLVLPVLLVLAAAVLMSLGRPLLYRQERVGRDGRVFMMYKFRTMRPDRRRRAATPDGPDRRKTHKHPEDPRLVPLGRFLRRLGLDELPQLVNILRGEMSLVGPRPELVDVVAGYAAWQHARHQVKPGLTGLWQVSERGHKTSLMHDHVELDLRYVRELSFRLDVRLLLTTIPCVLGLRRGGF
jgi:lipopolysaccharide/colanic/teichoic acid biosynthesis glycosyltransferase